jgi:hypothetical protein
MPEAGAGIGEFRLSARCFSAKKKTIKNLLKRYGIMADPILAPWNGEYPKMSQEFVSIIK